MRLGSRVLFAIFIGFVLANPLTVIQIQEAETMKKLSNQFSSSTSNEYEIVDTIRVTEESEFRTTGWSGNGSIENPYVLEGVHIIFNEYPNHHEAIFISNIDSHFVIRNCMFTGNGNGITFSHTSNGQIVSCLFNGSNLAIDLRDCSNVSVFNNTIINGMAGLSVFGENICISHNIIRVEGWGLGSGDCQNITISNNTVLHCDYGIQYEGEDVNIVDNIVAGCNNIGILIDGGLGIRSIYGNHIGFNGDFNAVDNSLGHEVKWDNGESQGNYWSDLGDNTTYTIPGTAGNIDGYPSQFTLEVLGPQITPEEYDEDLTIEGNGEPFTFRANVSDVSGVDTVLFYFTANDIVLSNWSVYEMESSNDPLYPDMYVITFESVMPAYVTFYFWANDSLGNYVRSKQAHIWFHARLRQPLWVTYVPYIVSGVVIVCLVYTVSYFRKRGISLHDEDRVSTELQ